MYLSPILQYNILEQKCTYFSSNVVYCGIVKRCIVGFVRLVYCKRSNPEGYGCNWPASNHNEPKEHTTWWRHQMETFSAWLAFCAGNSPVTGEFPSQRPVTRSFDVFFDLRLNKRLSKQSRRWWFETPSRSLWRHCNGYSSSMGILPVDQAWRFWIAWSLLVDRATPWPSLDCLRGVHILPWWPRRDRSHRSQCCGWTLPRKSPPSEILTH